LLFQSAPRARTQGGRRPLLATRSPARNLRHVVLLLDEWQARGITFITLSEGIDTSAAAGRLVAGVLGSIAEFERSRMQERIHAGLSRAKARGTRLGRRRSSAAGLLHECVGLQMLRPLTA
jgi:DNA invertase Pin-like site-specific DNA recombinase